MLVYWSVLSVCPATVEPATAVLLRCWAGYVGSLIMCNIQYAYRNDRRQPSLVRAGDKGVFGQTGLTLVLFGEN